MKETKKLTVGAISVALTVIFLSLGAFVEALDLTAAALASVIMVFMFIEVGSPYTYLVWLASSLLSFVFFPQSFAWINYFLIFGIYPVLKAYIERLPRVFWIPIRLVYFNAVAVLDILASELILGVPFFGQTEDIPFLGENTLLAKIVIYALLIVAMLVYDVFLTAMVRFYLAAVRPKIEKLLK
jgi:hypothetical protein